LPVPRWRPPYFIPFGKLLFFTVLVIWQRYRP
jgi:hypothetical protein